MSYDYIIVWVRNFNGFERIGSDKFFNKKKLFRHQLYIHGETVAVNISIRNHSNKVVKKIKASILQSVDIVLFQNGQYRNVVTGIETQLVLFWSLLVFIIFII